MASYVEGAAVADAKEADDPSDEGADNPVDAGYVKGLKSSVEGTVVTDAKEAGPSDSEGASTSGDTGSIKGVASYV